jgi:tetratricopeptide (TPR) repeat protein
LYTSRIDPAEERRTPIEKNGKQHRHRNSWSRRELYLFRWAAFVSILVMALHGLTDDALYGGQGTPFLFLGMGMAVVVSRRRSRRKPVITWTRQKFLVGGTAVLIALVLVLLFHRPLLARWYANVGAGQMARVDLAVWPSNNWGGFHSEMAYDPAMRQFDRALAYDPDNRTAQHRLGLIAMKTGDYATAVSQLETAYRLSPDHRGIRKSLGYSYVWLGEFDQALDILTPISELPMEMAGFQAWWINRDQPELSDNAEKMGAIFIDSVKSSQ